MTNQKNLNSQTGIPNYAQYEVEKMIEEKNKEETQKKNSLLRPKAGALSVQSFEKEF
ncbi:MAG: hypothetical protein ABSF44_15850 [Candidatus Bathyarchaeia archaeon]|jgi:hypothetical protein